MLSIINVVIINEIVNYHENDNELEKHESNEHLSYVITVKQI